VRYKCDPEPYARYKKSVFIAKLLKIMAITFYPMVFHGAIKIKELYG
jgi:hypothetical protein